MKRILTTIGSLLIFTGLKAQQVQVKKETSKAPVQKIDKKKTVASETNPKTYKMQKKALKLQNKAVLKTVQNKSSQNMGKKKYNPPAH